MKVTWFTFFTLVELWLQLCYQLTDWRMRSANCFSQQYLVMLKKCYFLWIHLDETIMKMLSGLYRTFVVILATQSTSLVTSLHCPIQTGHLLIRWITIHTEHTASEAGWFTILIKNSSTNRDWDWASVLLSYLLRYIFLTCEEKTIITSLEMVLRKQSYVPVYSTALEALGCVCSLTWNTRTFVQVYC